LNLLIKSRPWISWSDFDGQDTFTISWQKRRGCKYYDFAAPGNCWRRQSDSNRWITVLQLQVENSGFLVFAGD
jgi:hypothetical protein